MHHSLSSLLATGICPSVGVGVPISALFWWVNQALRLFTTMLVWIHYSHWITEMVYRITRVPSKETRHWIYLIKFLWFVGRFDYGINQILTVFSFTSSPVLLLSCGVFDCLLLLERELIIRITIVISSFPECVYATKIKCLFVGTDSHTLHRQWKHEKIVGTEFGCTEKIKRLRVALCALQLTRRASLKIRTQWEYEDTCDFFSYLTWEVSIIRWSLSSEGPSRGPIVPLQVLWQLAELQSREDQFLVTVASSY